MQNITFNKKTIRIILGALVGSVILAVAVWYYLGGKVPLIGERGVHITEELVLPDTRDVSHTAGRIVQEGRYDAPIAPTVGTRVISDRAVLTLKGAYDLALPKAAVWAGDAALVSVMSNGVITAEGTSGQWQVLFGSKQKKGGYEVIIYGNAIAAEKKVESSVYGYPVPENWYDSEDALLSVRTMPQFASATISALNFFYNEDGKRWGYAAATSKGTVAIPVR